MFSTLQRTVHQMVLRSLHRGSFKTKTVSTYQGHLFRLKGHCRTKWRQVWKSFHSFRTQCMPCRSTSAKSTMYGWSKESKFYFVIFRLKSRWVMVWKWQIFVGLEIQYMGSPLDPGEMISMTVGANGKETKKRRLWTIYVHGFGWPGTPFSAFIGCWNYEQWTAILFFQFFGLAAMIF